MKKMFFYGLFRRDKLGDSLLHSGGSYIGPRTVPGFTLFSTLNGSGVFARPAEGKEIKGDLYELPDETVVDEIDYYEGHPHNYVRREVSTTEGELCEVYVMQHSVEGFTMEVGSEWTPDTIRAAQINRHQH